MHALPCAQRATGAFVLAKDESEGAADCEDAGGDGEVAEEAVDVVLLYGGLVREGRHRGRDFALGGRRGVGHELGGGVGTLSAKTWTSVVDGVGMRLCI